MVALRTWLTYSTTAALDIRLIGSEVETTQQLRSLDNRHLDLFRRTNRLQQIADNISRQRYRSLDLISGEFAWLDFHE